jgi:hypothetical protein
MGNDSFPHSQIELNTTSVKRRVKNIESYELITTENKLIRNFLNKLYIRDPKLSFVPYFTWLIFLFPSKNEIHGLLIIEKGQRLDEVEALKSDLIPKLPGEIEICEHAYNYKQRLLKIFPKILENNFIECCLRMT